MKIIDLKNKTFGRLLVIGRAENNAAGRARWLCYCMCGKEKIFLSYNLLSGHSSSCGCLNREIASDNAIDRNTVHGHNESGNSSPTHKSWNGMKLRCLYPNHISYKNYGGRGIKICDRWLNFSNFLEDMGERPIGKTLDRMDNDGNYEPNNCKWSTKIEQQNNRRKKC